MTPSRMKSLAFILAILSNITDANIEESLELRIYDSDYNPSKDQMLALLKSADLEGHGFTKEITRKEANLPGSNKTVIQTTHLYYKTVSCLRIREVERELQKLMPGGLGVNVVSTLNREIKLRKLSTMNHCKVGQEIHFHEGYIGKNTSVFRQKRQQSGNTVTYITVTFHISYKTIVNQGSTPSTPSTPSTGRK